MIIHKNTIDLPAGCVATIGSFDGVHYGHRSIIRNLIDTASRYGTESLLMTFHPHPRKVLKADADKLRLLNTIREKEYLLERCGIDRLFEAEFTPEFANLSGEEFVRQYFVDRLRAKAVIVGYDHTFGKNRESGFEFLQQMGTKYGFDVFEIPKHDLEQNHVSSTAVRTLIQQGEIEKANELLTTPYFFIAPADTTGQLHPEEDTKLIPPPGEYRVNITTNHGSLPSKATTTTLGTIFITGDFATETPLLVEFLQKLA